AGVEEVGCVGGAELEEALGVRTAYASNKVEACAVGEVHLYGVAGIVDGAGEGCLAVGSAYIVGAPRLETIVVAVGEGEDFQIRPVEVVHLKDQLGQG